MRRKKPAPSSNSSQEPTATKQPQQGYEGIPIPVPYQGEIREPVASDDGAQTLQPTSAPTPAAKKHQTMDMPSAAARGDVLHRVEEELLQTHQELSSLQAQFHQMQSELANVHAERDVIQQQNSEWRQTYEMLQSEIMAAQEAVQEWKTVYETSKAEHKAFEASCQAHQEQVVNDWKQRLEEERNACAAQAVQEWQPHVIHWQQKFGQMEKEKVELETQNMQFQQQVKEWENKILNMQTENERAIEREVDRRVKEESRIIDGQCKAEVTEASTKLKAQEKEKTILQRELVQCQKEGSKKEKLQMDLSEASGKINALEREKQILERALTGAQGIYETLEQKYESMLEKKSLLVEEQVVTRVQSATKEIEILTEKKWQAAMIQVSDQAQAVERQNSALQSALTELESQLASTKKSHEKDLLKKDQETVRRLQQQKKEVELDVITKWKESLHKQWEKNDALKKKVETLEEKLAATESQYASLNGRCQAKLSEENPDLDLLLKQHAKDVEAIARDQWKDDLHKAWSKNHDLKLKIEILEDKLLTAQNQHVTLEKRYKQLLSEKDPDMTRILQEHAREIELKALALWKEDLHIQWDKNQGLRRKMEELEDELATLVQRHEKALLEKEHEIQIRLKEKTKEIDQKVSAAWRADLRKQWDKNAVCQTKVSELNEELVSVQNKYITLEQKLEQALLEKEHETLALLRDQKIEIEQKISKKWKADVHTAWDKNAQLKEQIKALQDDLVKAEHRYNSLAQKHEDVPERNHIQQA